MANTYSQISIHAVFAVKYRENVITKSWRDELHSYITGILKNENAKPLAVGGWLDHVHIFFALSPSKIISDIMRVVKASSSKLNCFKILILNMKKNICLNSINYLMKNLPSLD